MALIDKASLLMVPSTYEAGKLYNVLPSGNRAPDSTGENSGYDQTRADFDFDRGSNTAATRVNADGLIEKYRENLILQSQTFDNASWTKYQSSVTANSTTAPDGTLTAYSFFDTAANDNHQLSQNITFPASEATISIFAKANTLSHIKITAYDGAGFKDSGIFNLSNGTVSGNGVIVSAGNGWYRCSYTFSSTGGAGVSYVFTSNGSTTVYAGSGQSIFVWGYQLEQGLVATEYLESTSVTGKAGVLIDLPRIDYSSGAGALLLEPSRQQLVQYSEYFGDSSWIQSVPAGTLTLTSNYALSPDGYENAYRLQYTGGSQYFQLYQILPHSTNIFSIYAKSNTGANQSFRIWGNDFSQVSGDLTITSSWQRFDFAITGTGSKGVGIAADSTGAALDISIYGAQLEAGSYVTSYIPNHGESGGVTRAADSCLGGGNSDTFNDSEGVLYIEGSFSELIRLGISENASTSNRILIGQSTTALTFIVTSQTVAVVNTSVSGYQFNQNLKIAAKYKQNDFALWVNGVEVITDTSGNTPINLNSLDLKGQGFNAYGNVKQVAVFNEALSDSELETLTTL